MSNLENSTNNIEVRFFGQLKAMADQKGWDFPYIFELENECSAEELLALMDFPCEEIEAVFVEGLAKPLDEGWIKPGNRVGFIPYGVPGPYRVLLGIKKIK